MATHQGLKLGRDQGHGIRTLGIAMHEASSIAAYQTVLGGDGKLKRGKEVIDGIEGAPGDHRNGPIEAPSQALQQRQDLGLDHHQIRPLGDGDKSAVEIDKKSSIGGKRG